MRELNRDIYRSTISELSPRRDTLWVTCNVARMIQDWGMYADNYRGQYDAGVLEDGVLGPEWEAIGRGLRTLLDGRVLVDRDTADACIVRIFQNEGLEL